MKTVITPENFTRAKKLDVNGNPRYIIHFLHLNKDGDAAPHDISGKYAAAVTRANKLGGKKYHNKQYGGGIIFQSYALEGLCDELNNAMRGPLVWNELWDAMKETPSAWVETTEKMYWDMLEVLPPVKMTGRHFLVGEADHHTSGGEAVYACFKKSGTRFFARYLTVAQFSYA
jgi:hypothetical protein